jgi:DegV family protein with EDD domain
MIANKIRELAEAGKSFEEIRDEVLDYHNHLHTIFCLESLTNLSRNGRVNPAVAKVAGVLGIRVVGCATEGVLDPKSKCRGEKRSLAEMHKLMGEMGYQGGKVRISHCQNPEGAQALADLIRGSWPQADIRMYGARGLVSFYAEQNGVLVGFET